MTVKRLIAIAFIFACAAIAWFTLGVSIVHRTSTSSSELSQDVSSLWGGRHAQTAPAAWYWRPRTSADDLDDPDGDTKAGTREKAEAFEKVLLPLTSSEITVDLDLEHRRKGLLWHDTYTVDFKGRYTARLPENASGPLVLHFTFPSPQGIYDGFRLTVDGESVGSVLDLSQGAFAEAAVAPGEEATFEIAYRSRGLDHWRYLFASSGVAQIRDFSLAIDTDFDAVDFVPGTLSPTAKARSEQGWTLKWDFDSLVSGQHIGIDLPNRLNPGPLTSRITFFAPVSLLFFVTVMVMLGALGHLELHPMHYFFLAAAFFSFHLVLAYLVDHLSINLAFLIAAAVSIALVVSYLRLVCGFGRAVRYAGAAQFIFLILFSYAFFFEGYTGLAVTIGAVLTLFALMQLTGRVDWEQALGERTPRALTAPSSESSS